VKILQGPWLLKHHSPRLPVWQPHTKLNYIFTNVDQGSFLRILCLPVHAFKMQIRTSIKPTPSEPKIGEVSTWVKNMFMYFLFVTLRFQDHTVRKLVTVKLYHWNLAKLMRNNISNMKDWCVDHISKHWEESWKYDSYILQSTFCIFCMIFMIIILMILLSICTL